MHFHVVLVRPPGRPHARAFTEMVELVRAGLQRLGHHVTDSENRWESDAVNIVFGAHHLLGSMGAWPADMPPRCILYNLEPLTPGVLWTARWFQTGFSSRYPVWDYSQANAVYRANHGWSGAWYTVPVGYVPMWTRIDSRTQPDIDVLFYGSVSFRRRAVLDALIREGVKVQTLFGVYGSDRDAWIARARLVLNVHQMPNFPFESVRVAYLLANRKAVVAEGNPEEELDAADWHLGIAWSSYRDLVVQCQAWLANVKNRIALADRGFQIIQQFPEERILERALDQMHADGWIRDRPSFVTIR